MDFIYMWTSLYRRLICIAFVVIHITNVVACYCFRFKLSVLVKEKCNTRSIIESIEK